MVNWEFHPDRDEQVFRLFHRHGGLLIYIANQNSHCQICGESVPSGVQFQTSLINYKAWNETFNGSIFIIDSYPHKNGLTAFYMDSKQIESSRNELRPQIDQLLREYKFI